LGLYETRENDLEILILPLLQLLADAEVDYNEFFRRLCYFRLTKKAFEEELGPPLDPAFLQTHNLEDLLKNENTHTPRPSTTTAINLNITSKGDEDSSDTDNSIPKPRHSVLSNKDVKSEMTESDIPNTISKCMELLLASGAHVRGQRSIPSQKEYSHEAKATPQVRVDFHGEKDSTEGIN
jgi:hypothetical protein